MEPFLRRDDQELREFVGSEDEGDPLREFSEVCMIRGIGFASDSPLEGAVRCELVSAAGPIPPIKGSFIAGLMNS